MRIFLTLFSFCTVSALGQLRTTDNKQAQTFSNHAPNPVSSILPAPLGLHTVFSESAPENNVSSIFKDAKGQLWFGAANGVFKSNFNGELFKCGESICNHDTQVKHIKYLHNQEITKQFTNVSNGRNLIDFNVNCMSQDAHGVYWIGTQFHGLCRYDGREMTFYTKQEGLGDNCVNAVLVGTDGTIWVGTSGGVCVSVSNASNSSSIKAFTTFKISDGLPSNKVNALIQDHAAQIWVATDNGIAVFSKNRFVTIQLNGEQISGKVKTIEQDNTGIIWIGDEKGIIMLDHQNAIRIGRKQGLKNTRVTVLHKDASGFIWAGVNDEKDRGAGLIKIDISEFKKSVGQVKIKYLDTPFPQSEIQSIYETISGELWIGTSKGVGRFKNGQYHWLVVSMEGC